MAEGPGERNGSWTLLTGHGHVLVEITRHPDARIRDISPAVGLTERTVLAIVADLDAAGYLTRTRTGRRTRYTVNPDSPFRHPAQEGLRVGPVLDQLTTMADADAPGPEAAGHQRSRSSRGPSGPPERAGSSRDRPRTVPRRPPHGRMLRRRAASNSPVGSLSPGIV